MILNIAVCDDDVAMLSVLASELKRIFLEKEIKVKLETFSESRVMLAQHKKMPFQVVFLDISMPEMDGFQAAKELKMQGEEIFIIFITYMEELVYKSFDYQPFHFIRKGKNESLIKQLEHVVEKLIVYKQSYDKMEISLPYGNREEILINSIVIIQSEKNYLEYELSDGRSLRVRESLNAAEEKLKEYKFIRISNRAVVNLNYVGRIREKEGEVVLKGGYAYSISRNHKKSVITAFMKYLRSIK